MATSEVAFLSGSLIQVAQLVRDMGRDWYRASADWADFPLKLNRLERQHNFWVTEFTKLGLTSDTDLMQTLREAQSLLETEKARLEKKFKKTGSCGLGCCSNLSMTMFPDKVGFTVQRVIDAYNEIFNLLKKEEEAAPFLENRALRLHSFPTVHNDDRYVPLKITEDAVNAALNNSSGLSVVLLHGGPGKGKSTLARHLAHSYKEKTDPVTFEQVVYLECGPNADILAKQLELLQHFVWSSISLPGVRQSGSEILIPKRLSRILKDQKILIVFDDVWEPELVQRMVDLCGPGVKCLVTSQLGTLCHGINRNRGFITCIQIENIQSEDGRKILASHTGLSKQQITSDLERVMNRMLIETQGNPLALASIATAIDNHRSDDVEEWERAHEDFLRLLHSEDTAFIYGKKYPKSFWSAMTLSIQSLQKDVQDLLILTHLCDAPSVPEEVVSILYKRLALDGNYAPLAKSRKELESRELLKITTRYLILGESGKERLWSMHSLHKLFIEDELGDRKKSMLESLLGLSNKTDSGIQDEKMNVKESPVDEDAMVQTVLCALYFNRQFAKEAAKKMGVPLERFDNLRRNAIQPVMRLLGKPISDRWPETGQASARQVFLRYICDGRLQAGGIFQLLTLPISTLPVMSALRNIVTVDHNSMSDRMSDALSEIVHFPGVLQQLVNLLHKDDSPVVQELALWLLGQLLYSSTEAKLEIVHFPEACGKLVDLLSKRTRPRLRAEAARAIRNILLYADDGIKRKLYTIEGLVEGLLGLLGDGTKMYAEGRAVAALTLMDPDKGNGVRLHSWYAYYQRGWANMLLSLNAKSLSDLDKAVEENPRHLDALSARWTVRVKLGDFKGALVDNNNAIGICEEAMRTPFHLQERGILKRMMGDLFGALADLNKALELGRDDYETLKHRGYVKYLMKDEEGAHSDAKLALEIKSALVDMPGYELNYLGTISVAYLDYKLK